MPTKPYWSLFLPLISIAAAIAGRPDRRLWMGVLAGFVFPAMQWLLPRSRFRSDYYFSPVNLALFVMLMKLIAVPSLITMLGAESVVLTFLPTVRSMDTAVAIDILSYVAFCIGLSLMPVKGKPTSILIPPTPSPAFALIFACLGICGFFAAFGSVGRMVEYFTEPSAISDIAREQQDGGIAGLLGTVLRPFLAFALVSWWSMVADKRGSVLKATVVGLIAATGITLANLTYSFNRAAFIFPLVSLMAVYSARIRRIPFTWTAALGCATLPILMAIGVYRTNMMQGKQSHADDTASTVVADAAATTEAYVVGPQYTGIFYESIDWGNHLYYGSTLIASVMTPFPLLGKGFRETNGPALLNRAIYRIRGIEDQILPYDAELFANFHIPGVLVGFVIFGLMLVKAEYWFQDAGSTFSAFAIQYAGIWGAMLATWSLSIYSQILIYFFGPIYFYVSANYLRACLRRAVAPAAPVPLPAWRNIQ